MDRDNQCTDQIAFPDGRCRLILIGKTGAGKSSTGNTILGADLFKSQIGFNSETKECGIGITVRNGLEILVMDTPGLCDTDGEDQELATRITQSLFAVAPGPHVVILVMRCDARFTDQEVKVFEMLKDIFGPKMTSYLIAIFVGKDLLDKGGVDFNQMLQRSKKLKSVLEEADNRYLLFNNDANEQVKAEQVERLMLLVKHVVIKNGGGCFRHKVCRELDTAMDNMVKEEIQRRGAATLPMMYKKNITVAHEDQLAFMMKEPSNKDQVTDLDASDDDKDDLDKLCTQNHSQADMQVLNRQREMDNLKRTGAVRSLTRNFSLPLLPSPPPPPFARRPAPPPPPGPRPVLRNVNLPRAHSASEGLVSLQPQKPTRTNKPRPQSMVSAGLSRGNLLTGLKGSSDSSTFSKSPPPPPPPKPSHGNLRASIEVYSDSSTNSKPPPRPPPPPPPKPTPQGDFGATSSFWTNFSDYVVDVETLLDQIQDELGEDLTRADTADTTFAYQLPQKRHLTLNQKQRLVEDAMKKKIFTHPEELNDAQREEMQKAVKSVGQRIRKGMSKFSLMTIDKCQLM